MHSFISKCNTICGKKQFYLYHIISELTLQIWWLKHKQKIFQTDFIPTHTALVWVDRKDECRQYVNLTTQSCRKSV